MCVRKLLHVTMLFCTVLKVFLGALDGELIYCMRSDIPSVYAIREDVADDLLLSLDEVLQKKPDVQEQ